jgi:hypothetical protein
MGVVGDLVGGGLVGGYVVLAILMARRILLVRPQRRARAETVRRP